MNQSNTGDLTMREWFDQLSKQVEYVDSNKFLVELALKQGQSKDSTGNKTGDRNDRGKDRDGRRIDPPRQPLLVPIRILPMMRAITPTIRTTKVPTRKVPKTAPSSGARVAEEQII